MKIEWYEDEEDSSLPTTRTLYKNAGNTLGTLRVDHQLTDRIVEIECDFNQLDCSWWLLRATFEDETDEQIEATKEVLLNLVRARYGN